MDLAIDILCKTKKSVIPMDYDVLEALAELSKGPELVYIREEHYGDKFRMAMGQTLAALTTRQRALLKYYYVDKLVLKKNAVIYQIHTSTVARQLESIREEKSRNTRKHLQKHLDVHPRELLSLLGGVPCEITLGLRRSMDVSETGGDEEQGE